MIERAKFTAKRTVRILQETDRSSVAEVAKRHGVSERSIYIWRKKFGDVVTQRRACELMDLTRLGLVYECRMSIKDGPIIEAMRAKWAQNSRYGARRVRTFLHCDGICWDEIVRQGSGLLCGRCERPLRSPRNAAPR